MKPITQKIIDKYNEGQEVFNAIKVYDFIRIEIKHARWDINIYEFLVSPEYGFAKVVWGKELVCPECGSPYCESRGHAVKWINVLHDWPISWQYHLQQMVISEDWIEYIEDNI
jgi:hypothetical protein